MYMMMMKVLCPKAGSLAFMPSEDEISEVVSCCLPHRLLWVSNLSKVTMQWLEVEIRTCDPLVARHRTYPYTTAYIPVENGINHNQRFLFIKDNQAHFNYIKS